MKITALVSSAIVLWSLPCISSSSLAAIPAGIKRCIIARQEVNHHHGVSMLTKNGEERSYVLRKGLNSKKNKLIASSTENTQPLPSGGIQKYLSNVKSLVKNENVKLSFFLTVWYLGNVFCK